MPSITIRDVPEPVRAKLAARAAQEGRSMQEFLRLQLEALVDKPSLVEAVDRMERRVRATGAELSSEEILAWRDADRR